ncbi:MAG: DUF3341 domain-containing protein [Phycisphaerales bacterium]
MTRVFAPNRSQMGAGASGLYGLIAEFDTPEAIVAAAHAAGADGYLRYDAYAPFPVEGLPQAVGKRPTRLPWITLAGGLFGAVAGYSLQYYASVVSYPLLVGGRPLHSWPAFIPVTFECTILCAALASIIGMFVLNGLPRPYHPVFNVDGFERASQDRFFLCIESIDPRFELAETRAFLESLDPISVSEVEP